MEGSPTMKQLEGFRKSAVGYFKAALDCTTLEELTTTKDFTQFSGTPHFAVTVSHKSHLQSLAHPRIAPVITHVALKGFRLRKSQTAEKIEDVLRRLPKLRSVSLESIKGPLHLPLFPASLEELKIPDRPSRDIYWHEQWEGLENALPLTRYSQLTSLAIDLVVGARPSMESLSSLRNLRSLDLRGCSSAIGVLSTFTALTSLAFAQSYGTEDFSFQEVGCLTGLSRLALLMVWSPEVVTREELACIAQLTNLTCLDMSGCTLTGSLVASSALLALTRLVSVRFKRESFRMPQLSLPQLEALHSLGLSNVSDVSILGPATGLTHLGLACKIHDWDRTSLQGLCPAVARMSRLRSLEISVIVDPRTEYHEWPEYRTDADDRPVGKLPDCVCLDEILRACTTLTKLAYCGILRPDRDLEACASLPGLRSLSFMGSRKLTPAWLPALQAMSGLTELSLLYTGIREEDMTLDVIAAFDAKRRQLGWPPLKLRVKWMP